MKTKKPSAIVYGWYKEEEELLQSDVYWEENLHEDVVVISLPYKDTVVEDYSKYRPDLIVSIDIEINVPHYQLKKIHRHYEDPIPDNVLANIIVCQTVFTSCEVIRPRFSVFTPVYKTGERITRTNSTFRAN